MALQSAWLLCEELAGSAERIPLRRARRAASARSPAALCAHVGARAFHRRMRLAACFAHAAMRPRDRRSVPPAAAARAGAARHGRTGQRQDTYCRRSPDRNPSRCVHGVSDHDDIRPTRRRSWCSATSWIPPDSRPISRSNGLGIDSLGMVEMLFFIEEEFGVQLPSEGIAFGTAWGKPQPTSMS